MTLRQKSHPVKRKANPLRKKSQLRDKLRVYGLDGPTALAKAMGMSKSYAHQLLNGDGLGIGGAKNIARASGLPYTLILEWADNGR